MSKRPRSPWLNPLVPPFTPLFQPPQYSIPTPSSRRQQAPSSFQRCHCVSGALQQHVPLTSPPPGFEPKFSRLGTPPKFGPVAQSSPHFGRDFQMSQSTPTHRDVGNVEEHVESTLRNGDSIFPVEQVNGQKVCGPPMDYVGPEPSEDLEIFVRAIPATMTASDLIELFSRVGTVYKLRLMTNKDGTHRKFCFVQYTSEAETKQALYFFTEYYLRSGDVIRASKSRNDKRVLIDGLPSNVAEDRVLAELNCLTEGVLDVTLLPPRARDGNSVSALVNYESHSTAVKALRCLLGCRIADSPIFADWARPPPSSHGHFGYED